jgi:DNA-binding response OmpR family regulator
VGGGTTVTLYLPRYRGEETEPATLEPQPPVRTQRRRRILAVEDHDAVRQYTVDALTELGHEVLGAADAQQALDILNAGPIDLLFTDLVLPGSMSGHELARLARVRQPNIKVLYTTGYDRTVMGSLENNHILLAKPFSLAQLCARISSLFEER